MIASGNGLPIVQISGNALPKKLLILIVVLASIAVVILFWSSWQFANHLPTNNGWIILTSLALLTVPFYVNFPQLETIVLFGGVYLMLIALLYGPAACIISTAFYALLVLPASKSLSFRPVLFGVGFTLLVCDAFLYSMVYKFIKPVAAHDIRAYILPAVIMALISFLFTSLITASAVSWRHEYRILSLWVRAYPPLLLNSFIAAGTAACIAVWSTRSEFLPLAAGPVIGLTWWWTIAYKKRLMRKAALEKSL